MFRCTGGIVLVTHHLSWSECEVYTPTDVESLEGPFFGTDGSSVDQWLC